jgi:hypothetical protein
MDVNKYDRLFNITCIRKITERLFRLWVSLIVEDPTVTVKCRTAIKVMFIYFNLCVSVMLNSLSYLFTKHS